MKLILVGISVNLFGIALILTSSGGATAIGLGISLIGLIFSITGCFIPDKK